MIDHVAHRIRTAAVALATAALVAACSPGSPGVATGPSPAPAPASMPTTDSARIAQARADSARVPYTEADVRFMTHMIGHHAQAIQMSRLAPTHGASDPVLRLAERIINAQNDEIRLMQQWLLDRNQAVPEAKPMTMVHEMDGERHEMLMPGMLSDEEMAQLDAARGREFDRLFLQYMIRHHDGAVTMVDELFASEYGGNETAIYKLASDVQTDQTTEIRRMQQMLLQLAIESHSK